MELDVVLLAAGKGTRMRSSRPKVLHSVAGAPMLHHVIRTAEALSPRTIAVVVGHGAEAVKAQTEGCSSALTWVLQAQQLGTGHAVREAMHTLPDDGVVLVGYGDVPLVSANTLNRACDAARQGQVGLVVASLDDPAELGRIVRDASANIQAIVEYKDADASTRAIHEINSGILAAPAAQLNDWLSQLNTDNAQGELYLTDVIAMAVRDGIAVAGVDADPEEVIGVNDRKQLAEVERIYQRAQADRLMENGVTVIDPDRIDIRGEVSVGEDAVIDINVVLKGRVTIGAGAVIGPGVVIEDSTIGAGTVIHPHSVIEGAEIAANCSIGPFARLRPQAKLDDGVKIGNFVEVKKSHLGPGSKASHLAYLGDATFGRDCNIGAGAITANYDGVNKFKTDAGDNVFVGTNVTLVAPVELKDRAFLAAGSTVTGNVGENDLAVARGKQRNIPNWERPDQKAGKLKK